MSQNPTNSNTALKRIEQTTSAMQPTSLNEFRQLGDVFVKSRFFADTTEAAQAIVKTMAGAELGFPPIASMTGIYIVKGRISLSANLMASAIKRSNKYNYRVRKLDAQVCEIEFFERDQSIGISGFTMKEAVVGNLHVDWDGKAGQWKEKQTWKKFPKNMLFARAMSNGARWFCPDIFGGPVYLPDEVGDEDNVGANVIDVKIESGESITLESKEPFQRNEFHNELIRMSQEMGHTEQALARGLSRKFNLTTFEDLDPVFQQLTSEQLTDATSLLTEQLRQFQANKDVDANSEQEPGPEPIEKHQNSITGEFDLKASRTRLDGLIKSAMSNGIKRDEIDGTIAGVCDGMADTDQLDAEQLLKAIEAFKSWE